MNAATTQTSARRWRLGFLGIAAWLLLFILWRLPQMSAQDDYAGITALWILAGVAYALGVASPGTARGERRAGWCARPCTALALLAIALLALVLRVWEIGTIPFTLAGDEASQGLEAIRIIEGEIRSPFVTGWYGVPTLSFFFNSLTLRAFGYTTTALRLPWALVGVAAVLVTFWLVTRLKGVRLGLITAALVALYHYHIHYSRLGSNQIADTLFVSLALFFFWRARQCNRHLDWAGAGAVCGLALYFYAGARLAPIVLAAVVLYLTAYDYPRFWREQRGGLLVALGAFVIVGAPILQYALAFPGEFHGRVFDTGIIQSGWLANETVKTGLSIPTLLWNQFLRGTLAFNVYPDTRVWYGLRTPLLDPFFGALFLLGLGYGTVRALAPRGDRRLFPMVAWWWGGALLGGMLTESPPSSQRLITLSVPTCFFIALALTRLGALCRRVTRRFPTRLYLVGAVILFGAISLNTYFVDYTPRRIYGGWLAEAATMLAPRLNELKATHRIYFVGAPTAYWGFATFPFLVPAADARDLLEPLPQPVPSDWVTRERGATFIFVAARMSELKFAQATFPRGELQEIRAAEDNRVLALLYVVPPNR